MTAEVNSPAAACPHAHGKKPTKGSSTSASDPSTPETEQSCGGFGQRMREIAEHAAQGGAWEVRGATSSSPSLSTDREVSSIPKGDYTPGHQVDGRAHWEYPSEEMYYRAMRRKGWDPEAGQMKTIVAIHNSVNEQSWREVLRWEHLHHHRPRLLGPGTDDDHGRVPSSPPKLKRFIGRPSDFSPKARLMNLLGWSVLPFDRHDWIVEREDGEEVRYVIDFYSGQPEPGKPLSVYLDVRPALDSVGGLVDRLRWQFYEKVVPLLPFRGGALGASSSSTTTNSNNNSAPASTEGRSKVIPRNEDE